MFTPAHQEVSSIHTQTDQLSAQVCSLQTRVQDHDDRLRRNNLIFYGIPDSEETWAMTEEKVISTLNCHLSSPLSSDAIERAHRLGTFSQGKCRPIIVKCLSYKTKDALLATHIHLKKHNITVAEDFSPATRAARKKLLDFAKSQPGPVKHKLSYNKLLLNQKCYMYDPNSDAIINIPNRSTRTIAPPATSKP